MQFLISIILGYAIGSIPTAYLILKKTRKIDITSAGTGNVGAMNSYEVTNSKTIGIIVLLIDFIKGILPLVILKIMGITDFAVLGVSLIACVFAHCYNPWLLFKGGRGLASAAGGSAAFFPFLLVVWGILWLIFYFMKKDITLANVLATVMSFFVTLTSINIALKYTYPKLESEAVLILFVIGLYVIILSKHIEPLQQFLETTKFSKKVDENDLQQ